MVIPAARAGKATTKRIEVINTLQANSGTRNMPMPYGRMFTIVTIIFIAPMIEDAPARCILSIAKSTLAPAWDLMLLNGG